MPKYSIEQFENMFKEADVSKDHKISLPEIISYLQSKSMKVNEDRTKKYFAMFDKDQSQYLDIKEWVRLMEVLYGDE
ncbi:EF-hand_domain pair [Hexamita inflata]|uniref:EF-hand domain pair n=1 Tax=Hexamita inflata TaxID=28002 RepID=A0AA86RF58_9EUKA|nr:EF-hand domain pair [Hexamita inflata]